MQHKEARSISEFACRNCTHLSVSVQSFVIFLHWSQVAVISRRHSLLQAVLFHGPSWDYIRGAISVLSALYFN